MTYNSEACPTTTDHLPSLAATFNELVLRLAAGLFTLDVEVPALFRTLAAFPPSFFTAARAAVADAVSPGPREAVLTGGFLVPTGADTVVF